MIGRARATVRAAASLPFRVFPNSLRRRLLQAIFTAVERQAPREAMSWLLQADSDLTVAINSAAMRYGDGIHVKHRLIGYHDFFVERIRPHERVLDVGCGYGAVAHSIASRADAHVTGIDLDGANIATARVRFPHPRLTFVHGDALKWLPEQRYDVVVLSNVLEHIEHRVEFAQRLVDHVHPERLLVRVPMADRDWRVPLRRELGLFPYSDLGHFTEYTVASFYEEMREANLDVVEARVNWGELWAVVRAR